MMKFFKRIRFDLIEKNKTVGYLKYAAGEIVLVVFGILIALQVNNWNAGKKINQLEISALKELRTNLLEDIKDFQADLQGYGIAANSCGIIVNFIDGQTTYHDSLNFHLGKIRIQGVFSPTKITYQKLKLSGFKVISNDSLRKAISDLYEVRYQYVEKYIETEYQIDNQILGTYYLKEMQEYSPYSYAKPVNFKRLIGNQEFRNMLMHRKMKIEDWFENLYQRNIIRASQIIKMIDKEIEK